MMAVGDDVETPENDKKSPLSWLGFPASTPSIHPSYNIVTPELHPLSTQSKFPHPPVCNSIVKADAITGGNDCQLHGLLDCAIRNLVSSNPSKVAHGIEQNPSTAPKLSDIAPSIFSPGYDDVSG